MKIVHECGKVQVHETNLKAESFLNQRACFWICSPSSNRNNKILEFTFKQHVLANIPSPSSSTDNNSNCYRVHTQAKARIAQHLTAFTRTQCKSQSWREIQCFFFSSLLLAD